MQIASYGDWPTRRRDGSPVVQHLDEKAVAQLVDSFPGEILVDADHQSQKGGSTEALAWITELKADPERGLIGTFRWTDAGAAAVTGRRYRFVSASWITDEDDRPLRLLSVALTNRPNIPSDPILNSVQTEYEETTKETNPKGKKNMGKIRAQLGLGQEATEDEIVAAIAAIQQELDDVKRKGKEAAAEQFANENACKVSDPEVLKNAYLADPEMAKKIVDNIKPAETTEKKGQALLNSRAALTPPFPSKSSKQNLRNELLALPPDKRQSFYYEHMNELESQD